MYIVESVDYETWVYSPEVGYAREHCAAVEPHVHRYLQNAAVACG